MDIYELTDLTGFEIKKFRDLDVESQIAIVTEKVADSYDWDFLGDLATKGMAGRSGLRTLVIQALPLYVAQYGDVPFGLATVPAELMKSIWLEANGDVKGFDSWDEYFRERDSSAGGRRTSAVPAAPIVPVRLSDEASNPIDEGWDKCFEHLDAGCTQIPILFTPDDLDLENAAGGRVLPVREARMLDQMIEAIKADDVEAVRSMIARGYVIDQKVNDEDGCAIHLAARLGRADICIALLEAGCAVDLDDDDNDTPLHHAVKSGDVSTVKVFLEAGADVNSNMNWTPMHVAVDVGDTAIIELLAADADLNETDNLGRTPLQRAAEQGKDEICVLLIERGADPNVLDISTERVSPLHLAAEKARLTTCKVLIQNGADVWLRNSGGLIPESSHDLQFFGEDAGEVKRLLEEVREGGPHYVIDGATEKYLTPFQHAVHRGDIDYVRQVLAADPDLDIDMLTAEGQNLTLLAGGFDEIKQLLLATKATREIERSLQNGSGVAEVAPARSGTGFGPI